MGKWHTADFVQMAIVGLTIDPFRDTPIVLLKECTQGEDPKTSNTCKLRAQEGGVPLGMDQHPVQTLLSGMEGASVSVVPHPLPDEPEMSCVQGYPAPEPQNESLPSLESCSSLPATAYMHEESIHTQRSSKDTQHSSQEAQSTNAYISQAIGATAFRVVDMTQHETHASADSHAASAHYDSGITSSQINAHRGRSVHASEASLAQSISKVSPKQERSESSSGQHAPVVSEQGGDTSSMHERFLLPIWVSEMEAHAIATELLGVQPPRPMTHALMKSLLMSLGGQVKDVLITSFRENVFYAQIHLLDVSGQEIRLNARPADALALGVRFGAAIWVHREVLSKAIHADESNTPSFELDAFPPEQWQDTLRKFSSDALEKYKH
ncbi:MAG: bifunctional nuclease family protein [Myxococcota bacterium]